MAQLGLPYGINNSAGQPGYKDSIAILAYARQSGITTLDTADAYGSANDIIGSYNKAHAPFQVINKIKGRQPDLRTYIVNALNKAGITSFEVLHFHAYKDYITYPDQIRELAILKKDGLIKKTGISIYNNEEMEGAIDSADIDVIQLPFNLLDNYSKRGKLIEKAQAAGKEIHTRSVFLQGLFFMNPDALPAKIKPLAPYLCKIRELANAYSLDVHTLALNYALQQPGIDRVIIGVETVAQLEDNIKRLDKHLDPEILSAVNEINVAEAELLSPSLW